MPKIMLHDDAARKALGRGVAQLAKAVRGTLGPRGMNAIIDRPIGTPIDFPRRRHHRQRGRTRVHSTSRGVQREVSMKTLRSSGGATRDLLADAMVQQGLGGSRCRRQPGGIGGRLGAGRRKSHRRARASAKPSGKKRIACAWLHRWKSPRPANWFPRRWTCRPKRIANVEYGTTVETLLEVVDGMAFDRGYLSHHMVTDVERMQVVLDAPYILMTDLKLMTQNEVAATQSVIAGQDRPLLIIAEEVAPACVISLLSSHEKGGPRVAAIHPPDYGHWRKSMLDDIAIMTGGRVIARDLGGRIDHVTLRDLGAARQVRISANQTVISAGGGDPVAIGARREQVMRQVELSPPNIERDKLQERLARLAGGAAMILAGGATPVEQKRHAQLIEDAINDRPLRCSGRYRRRRRHRPVADRTRTG